MPRNLVLLTGFILFFFHLAHASVPDWSREAKVQVCGHVIGDLQAKLSAHDVELMQVMYFDSGDFAGKKNGVYLRLRVEENKAQVTLKYRQEDLEEHPLDADCEVDVSGTSAEGSCSWERDVSLKEAHEVMRGESHLISLLSRDQLEIYTRLMGSAPTEEILSFGPVTMKRWKIQSGGSGKKWRLEAWDLKASNTIHEVSFREDGDVAIPRIQTSLSHFITSKQLSRCSVETSKADRVLEIHRQFSR